MYSIRRHVISVATLAFAVTALACANESPSAPAPGSGGTTTSGGQTRSEAVGLSVTPGALALKVGTVAQLNAALVDGAGAVVEVPTGALPWRSSNTAVATVNDAGAVTAVSAGEATISLTSGGFTGSSRVVVTP